MSADEVWAAVDIKKIFNGYKKHVLVEYLQGDVIK